MQYLVTLTLDQLAATPAELHSAMTEFVEREIEAGNFVLTGGLAPAADGVRVELSSHGAAQDGPHLPVHGFAVVESSSLEEAVEVASRMLRLHRSHVPTWTGNCEVRPIVTHRLP